MKFKLRTEKKRITVTRHYVTIAGQEFDFNLVREAVEGIRDTNPVTQGVVLYHKPLEAVLEKLGVFERSSRGSGWAGKSYEAFAKEVERLESSL